MNMTTSVPQTPSLFRRIMTKLAAFAPGIFLIGYSIGTGSITTMAKAGANYGVSLMWAVALSCIVTWFLIRIYGRYASVTGERALTAFRRHIHPGVAMLFLIGLTVAVSGSIMGVMGILADVMATWSTTWFSGGISALAWAIAMVIMINVMLWTNSNAGFDKILSALVGIMGLAFVINFFIMMPPVADLLAGFIPSVPDPVAGDNSTPFLIISGMVGTTVAPAMFLMRTTLVKSNGWGVDNLPHQNRDAIVSAGMMFIISAAVMAAAAGTLYQTGTGLNNASQMVIILEPIAGSAAVGLFVIGIVAAGLSSQFPNLLLTPWLLADWRDTSNEVSPGYRILMTVMSLLCLVVPLFHARPVLVMIASQAFNAVILPLTVLCMFWLANKPSLMGKYRCSRWENVMFIAISVFTLIMGYMAMSGLIESLMK